MADSKKTKKTSAEKKDNVKVNKPAKSDSKKSAKPEVVAQGHVVSVEYTGTLDSGEEFDSSKHHGPIEFMVGASQVIKGFDDAVVGMKMNESKKIKITKDKAYGDVNPQLMHKVPVERLPPDIKSQVKIGGFLVLQGPQGQQIPAKVVGVDDKEITLDLNHPLAGKDLTFDIRIVDISTAEDHAGHDHSGHDHAHDHSHEGHDHQHDHSDHDEDEF